MIHELFIDVETTGLDPRQHAVHQLSCMLFTDNKLIETLNLPIKPHERAKIDPKALEVCGKTRQQVMAYEDRKNISPMFFNMLRRTVDRYDPKDKMFFCAYNAHFDNGFVRKFMEQNGDKYFGSYFWSNSIDVMVLASQHLKEERHNMKNFKQATVAEHLGIGVDNKRLHDSLYDVELMKQIYDIVK